MIDAAEREKVARLFHETYERLAPEYGYVTRKESAVPWEQVPENNRKLMIATCGVVGALCANEALERVCGLITIEGDKLKFGPFSIGHNPKRVEQEHTMLVELVRALKAEG